MTKENTGRAYHSILKQETHSPKFPARNIWISTVLGDHSYGVCANPYFKKDQSKDHKSLKRFSEKTNSIQQNRLRELTGDLLLGGSRSYNALMENNHMTEKIPIKNTPLTSSQNGFLRDEKMETLRSRSGGRDKRSRLLRIR